MAVFTPHKAKGSSDPLELLLQVSRGLMEQIWDAELNATTMDKEVMNLIGAGVEGNG